jgi:hypothetical protein
MDPALLRDVRSTLLDALMHLDHDTPEGREGYLMRLEEILVMTRELAAEWHVGLSTIEGLAIEAGQFSAWADGRKQALNMIAALGKQSV